MSYTLDELNEIAKNLQSFITAGETEFAYENRYTGELTVYPIPTSPGDEYRLKQHLQEIKRYIDDQT